MSEQLPTQPQFDPLAEARSRADVGRQIYDQMMEEKLDPSMSVQDRAQGHADMADYLEKRPTRAPKHMKDGKGFDVAHYNDTLDETNLETQSLNELVTSWAESEDANDRTKAMDVQDEIERRLLKEENMSDDLKLSLIDRLSNQKDALRTKNSARAVSDTESSLDEDLDESENLDTEEEIVPLEEDDENITDEDFLEEDPTIENDLVEEDIDGDHEEAVISTKRRTKAWNRVKKAGRTVTPTAILVRGKNAIADRDSKEPMTRNKKIGIAVGILAAGAAGTYAAIKYGTPTPKHNEFTSEAVDRVTKSAQRSNGVLTSNSSLTESIAQNASKAGRSADTSLSIPVLRGEGFARTLESSGLVAPGKGAKVVEALDRAGYLEGDKIAGVGKRGGKIVNYFRGNGTGNYRISAEAQKIIEEAQV